MADDKKHVYDESKVKTLSSLEHVRLRMGMYIGRIGNGSHYDDGCYILLKEVVDNAIDEYIMGHGRGVEIKIEGMRVIVRDFGRGIPLGKVVDCVSQINTGAKYNDDVFQFSVGLNGVGTKAVNALSKEFRVRSAREEELVRSRREERGMGDRASPPFGVRKPSLVWLWVHRAVVPRSGPRSVDEFEHTHAVRSHVAVLDVLPSWPGRTTRCTAADNLRNG